MSERNNGGTLAPILLRQTAGYGGQALSLGKGEGRSPRPRVVLHHAGED